jgi:hypothetical protein
MITLNKKSVFQTPFIEFKPDNQVRNEPFLGNYKWLEERRGGSLHVSPPEDYNPHLDFLTFLNSSDKQVIIDTDLYQDILSDPQSSRIQKKKFAKIYVKTDVVISEVGNANKSIKVKWSIAISEYSDFTGMICLPYYPIFINSWVPLHYIPDSKQYRIPIFVYLGIDNVDQWWTKFKSLKKFYFKDDSGQHIRFAESFEDQPKFKRFIQLYIEGKNVLEMYTPVFEHPKYLNDFIGITDDFGIEKDIAFWVN